ncbi:MAG: Spy/CpxP family protein refolding chaperone [Giesbergeria sp.]
MKPWIKRTLFGMLGATLLAGSLSACSSGHGWRHGQMDEQSMTEMRGKMLERVGSKLALDTAQKQKLDHLAGTLQAQRKAFMGESAQPREALQALVAGTTFDRAGAQTLVDAKVRAVQTGSPEVIAAMGDFYDSLKPDQQTQVREMMSKRRGWMRRRG